MSVPTTDYCSLITDYRNMWRKIWNRENVAAMILCLVLILLLIVTTSDAPTWIYQAF